MSSSKTHSEESTGPTQVAPSGVEKRVASDTLFAGAKILFIDHNGSTYSLRQTRNGKLILTK